MPTARQDIRFGRSRDDTRIAWAHAGTGSPLMKAARWHPAWHDGWMDYRPLGRSGLHVSPVCLGTMMFGERTGEAGAREIVAHARDAGINFVDTADVYAGGESERITGHAIRADRARWILATKVANVMPGAGNAAPHTGGLSRRWLMAACDASLQRLGTDYVDIYYLHRDDPVTPLAETVATVGDLIRAGKVRYFGVSNFRGWRIAELMRWCDKLGVPPPVVSQPYYNLLNRMPEVEVLAACDYYGIGVATYSPIARGVLTGKYAGGSVPDDSRAAHKDKRLMETEFRAESLAIAAKLDAHARATGRTLIQLALGWLWANRIVTSIIAGPRTLDQWRSYVDAIGTPWSAEDEALVDSLVAPGHPSTPGYSDPQYPLFGRRLAPAVKAPAP
jgi:aryl-alcohol dehydrogenase-like predicted oxidoreductase